MKALFKLTLALTLLAASLAFAASERPNVILIMADDFGQECLGAYGGTSYKTPALDKLADDGALFRVCVSGPICTPSRVQIMSGQYNHRNYKKFSYYPPEAIDQSFAFPMKEAGYRSALIGKWQLGQVSPGDMGFDEWSIQISSAPETLYWGSTLDENGETKQLPAKTYAPDYYCQKVIDFIQRDDDTRPFFIYYPMRLTHAPFASTPLNEQFAPNPRGKDKTVYFPDMVHYTDIVIDRIVTALDEAELSENTIVMFTGDNGTPGQMRSMANGQSVRGGKSRMNDVGTNVPLLIKWPARVAPGTVIDTVTDFTDFRATLVDLVGQSPQPEYDGLSFLPALLQTPGPRREWAFNVFMGRLEGNRNHGFFMKNGTYFARTLRYALDDAGKLYDLSDDPEQQRPLPAAEDDPERRKVRQLLQSAFESVEIDQAALLEITPKDQAIKEAYLEYKERGLATEAMVRALNRIALIRNQRDLSTQDWAEIDAIWNEAAP